jgi:hypothetical protein
LELALLLLLALYQRTGARDATGNIPSVGAAPPSGSNPVQIRELLATAQGYTVLGREGRRVGVVIELAEPDGERLAIRHDGIFLWKRRLLPMTAVASVVPERRVVVLNVDRRMVSSTLAAVETATRAPPSAEEAADVSDQWQERVARYASTGENAADHADSDRADATKQSAESAGPALLPEDATSQPAPEPSQRDQRTAARHLQFVPTSHGYVLLEREGPPPPLGQGIEVPEQPGSFRVAKLAPSPLPNDQRICVYLEQTE